MEVNNRCQNQSEGTDICTIPNKSTVIQYCNELKDINSKNDIPLLLQKLDDIIKQHPEIEPQSLVDTVREVCSPFLELGFNIYVFYLAFTRSECASDYMVAITSFLKNYFSFKDIERVVEYVLDVNVMNIKPHSTPHISLYETEDDVFYGDEDIEPQSFGDFSPRQFLDNWKNLSDSELLKKSQRVVYGLVSAGLVKQFNLEFTSSSYKVFAERDLKNFSFSGINDLMYNVAELMVTFAETGYECFVERSITPLLVSNRVSRTWLKRLQSMYDTHAMIHINPNPDHPALLEELDSLIADGQRLLRTENKAILLPYFRPLMDFRADYMAKHGVSSMRRCPWSCLIHGPPGIGKTSVSMMIAAIYKNVVVEHGIYPNLKWDPKKNLYNRNHDDEYWSGYKGAVHWCIMEDDLAKETPNHLSKGIKDGPLGSIQLVNTVGMATNQADLADKGKIPLLPKCVIANTNWKDLHAHLVIGDTGALLRRYPNVIKPVLKPQYKDRDTGIMIKSDHIISDAWLYQIETVCVLPGGSRGSTVVYKPYLPGENLATGEQLCEFLTESILSHERASALMEQSISRSTCEKLCSHGVLTSFHCSKCSPISTDCTYSDVDTVTSDSGSDTESIDGLVTDIEPQCDTITNPFCMPDGAASVPETSITHASWLFLGGVPELMLLSLCFWWLCNKIHPHVERFIKRCICGSVYILLTITPPRYRGVVIDFLLYWKFLCFGPVVGGTLRFLDSRVPWEVEQHRQALMAVAGFCVSYVMTRAAIGTVRITTSTINKMSTPSPSNEVPPIFPQPVIPQGNVWNRKKVNENFSVPNTISIGNDYQLIASIKSSMFRLGVIDSGKSTGTHALAIHIGGGNYLTVSHLFTHGVSAWSCTALLGKGKNNFRNKIVFSLIPQQIRRLKNDLAIFSTSAVIPRKSLRSFICSETDEVSRKVRSVTLSMEGDIVVHDGFTTELKFFKYSDKKGGYIQGHFFDGVRSDKSICSVGDCGTILVADTAKGWIIKSMHVAGSEGTSRMISTPISNSVFDFTTLPLHYLNHNEPTYFDNGNVRSGKLGDSKDKSISLWCEQGNADHIGSFQGRSTSTSRTKETMISDDICNTFGIVNNYTAPLMVPTQNSSGEWLNPYTIAATSQSNPCDGINDAILGLCRREYEQPLCHLISEMAIEVGPLSISQAINGIPGNDKINSLPMSTSGGFLFPGPKRNYFKQCPDTGLYLMSDAVRSKYDEIIACYDRGERACVLFNGALKDEPVTLKKRKIGKTRVFTACDVAFSIVVRQYFARAAAVIMNYNITSECAVSMNCYSEDWKDIYTTVTKFGDNRMIAGDYKAFDKSMPAVAIGAAFDVLISMIMANHEITAEETKILVGIKTDVSWPITNINGDVIQFFGGNSSGHPLTVIINSIVNSLYIRLAYLSITTKIDCFRQNVALFTLGDDNIMGSLRDDFNHTSISTVLDQYGITYTMPDKESVSVPFVDISEIDFLKRKFVRRGSDVVGPLALDSVYKSLLMEVQKENISSEERLAQAYLAARREWSLHGKEVFDDLTSKMEMIISKYPRIRSFCGNRKYKLSYDETYDWVCGRLEHLDIDEPSTCELDLLDY